MMSFTMALTGSTVPVVRAGVANVYILVAAWFVLVVNGAGHELHIAARIVGTIIASGFFVCLYLRTACRVVLSPAGLELLLPFTRRMYPLGQLSGIAVRPYWSHSACSMVVRLRGSRWPRRFILHTSGRQKERLLREMPPVIDALIGSGLKAGTTGQREASRRIL